MKRHFSTAIGSIVFVASLVPPLAADVRVVDTVGPGAVAGVKAETILKQPVQSISGMVVLVPGGIGPDGQYLVRSAVYETQARDWSDAPNIIPIDGPDPPANIDYSMASNSDTAFMFGGFTLGSHVPDSSNRLFTMQFVVENQEPVLKTSFVDVPGIAPLERYEHATISINYPFEGFVTCGGNGGVDHSFTDWSDCWKYDIGGNSWREGPNLGNPMTGLAMARLGESRFIALGWGPGWPEDRIATVLCDLATNVCEQLHTWGLVPPPVFGHEVFIIPAASQGGWRVAMIGGQNWMDGAMRHEILTLDDTGEWSDAGFALPGGLTKFAATLLPDSRKNNSTEILIFGGAEDWLTPVYSNTTYIVSFDPPVPTPDYAVPAIARVQGSGAFFTSVMHLFNGGSSDLEFEMTFTPRQGGGGEVTTVNHTVPAGVLQTIEDPLEALFGFGGSAGRVGSALITVTSGSVADLMVQTVVFAQLDSGEEYGQFFPAMELTDAIRSGQTAYLNTTEDSAHNRVNIGLMAVSDGTRFRVTPVDPLGAGLAAARIYDLDTGGNTQINDLHSTFGLGSMADVVVEIEVETGSGLAYASVLDGSGSYDGTSDPTTILPVIGGSSEVCLLEIGSIQGLNEFSGSASITNYSPFAAAVRADFFQRGVSGVTETSNLNIAAGDTLGFADLGSELFGVSGDVGTVILTATNGTLIGATGREFAVFRGPGGGIVGTAGQLIAGQTEADRLQAETTHHYIGLRQERGGGAVERSHFAVYNPETSDAEVTVRLYDGATGVFEGQRSWIVGTKTLIQVNNVIRQIDPNFDDGEKRIEVEVDRRVFMNAFRVNRWGDPVTLSPFPG